MLNWLKKDKVDHPFADAAHAKAVIDAFPVNDPWQALEDANHWLDSINATKDFKFDKRFELIDAVDVAVRRSQRKLFDTYLALKSDDKIQERRIWNTVTTFWKLLAEGYLACMAQAQDAKSIANALKPRLPVIAARGTRALRNQIKWVLMRYSLLRADIWGEVAGCTAFAEGAGCADTMVEIYPGEQSSVRHEFLRVMMFWAASPGGLSPVEQDIAERIIFQLTPQFGFTLVPSDSSEFCFDLKGPRPPLRWMQSVPQMVAPRFFEAIEARNAAQALLTSITSTGAMPADLMFPGANVAGASRVLKYLLFNWAKEMRPRASERRKTAMSLHIVHGYENVLTAVAPELGEGLDFSGQADYESWIAEDASVGGYGLIAPAGKGGWLKVGMLVGVRTEMESSWSVGMIRRVKGDAHQQFRIGVQLMAKMPVAVKLSLAPAADNSAALQHALLLSAKPSPNGSLHIIARRDVFSGSHVLEGVYGNPPAAVKLDAVGIIESGFDFDWLRYKLCEQDEQDPSMLLSLKLDISGN